MRRDLPDCNTRLSGEIGLEPRKLNSQRFLAFVSMDFSDWQNQEGRRIKSRAHFPCVFFDKHLNSDKKGELIDSWLI